MKSLGKMFFGCVLIVWLIHPGHSQQGEVVIKPHKISDQLFMLEGQGGNIGFLSNEGGVLIVDTQFPHVAPKILKTVGEMSQGKIQFVLNTHFHGDHTGGNAVIGAEATIIAHDRVRERLSQDGRTSPAAYPDLTYASTMTVYFGSEEIQLIHLGPGHTDSDSIIYFKSSNTIHMGDQFFHGRFPYIDLASGGTPTGYLNNIRRVAGMTNPQTHIIPGHGPLATQNNFLEFIAMFEECSGIVLKAKMDGKSLEQTIADGLPEKYRPWGTGFIKEAQWITFLYTGSREPSPAP